MPNLAITGRVGGIYLRNGEMKNHVWAGDIPHKMANKILLIKQTNQDSV